jgi:hypothetical protein
LGNFVDSLKKLESRIDNNSIIKESRIDNNSIIKESRIDNNSIIKDKNEL